MAFRRQSNWLWAKFRFFFLLLSTLRFFPYINKHFQHKYQLFQRILIPSFETRERSTHSSTTNIGERVRARCLNANFFLARLLSCVIHWGEEKRGGRFMAHCVEEEKKSRLAIWLVLLLKLQFTLILFFCAFPAFVSSTPISRFAPHL